MFPLIFRVDPAPLETRVQVLGNVVQQHREQQAAGVPVEGLHPQGGERSHRTRAEVARERAEPLGRPGAR